MKNIIIWFRAVFLNYDYYRVRYYNGTKTRLLNYRQAKGCKDVFGGIIYIDYKRCREFII